jgi:hypothetical protein
MGYVLLIRPHPIIVSTTLLIILVGMIILISLLGHSPLGQGQDDDNNIITGMSNISSKRTMETFDIKGPIAGLIYSDMQYNRPMAPEIISGKWDLKVIRGKVDHFLADFVQIAISGSTIHKVEITNFTEDNKDIDLTISDTANSLISGTTDVIFDDKVIKNIPIEIFINKLKVIEMRLYITTDHLKEVNLYQDPFRKKPITGVIDSLIDKI